MELVFEQRLTPGAIETMLKTRPARPIGLGPADG